MAGNQVQIDALKKMVLELAQDEYQRNGHGLLLSMLGELLLKRIPDYRELLGDIKLSKFLEQVSEIQLITSPENPIVKVVLPKTVSVDGDISTAFPNHKRKVPDSRRYYSAIWSAFSKPLNAGYVRIVGLEPHVHFKDVPESSDIPSSKIIVERPLISDVQLEANSSKKTAKINENIEKWLSDNNIDITRVIFQSKNILSKHAPSDLGGFINSLSESDLKRIRVPLDIIAKFIQNR